MRSFSGQRLREARIAAGLRPEQLAVAIDRSYSSICLYEREKAKPTVPVLVRLATVLGIPIDSLFATSQEVGTDAAYQ